jgi:DNA-3-methyladenine glycosylase II
MRFHMHNRIETTQHIQAGTRALKRLCPDMARLHKLTGDPPLRRWSPGFDGLTRIVVGQQLSQASANAILARLTLAVIPLTPANLLAVSPETLRAAGLSAAKIATLRALASAIVDTTIDLAALADMPADDVRARLTAVHGIGPWTVDIYLLFGRGDVDAFAPGDLALQTATQRALNLDTRPTAAELTRIAARWQPWRGIAARLLWAYYPLTQTNRAKPP